MDWDDVCWNPHESSFRQGQEEGFEAGNLAGYRDGQALGRTKGLEFGMELGFIRGFIDALEHEEDIRKTDRTQRSLEQLRKVLEDESLRPDEIFRQQQLDAASKQQDPHDDSETVSKLDVIARMQRIRARFKVLTVQLGIPKFTLKEVMDEAATSSTAVAEPKVDSEW